MGKLSSCHQEQIQKILNYTEGFCGKHSVKGLIVMSWEPHVAQAESQFYHLLAV